MDDFLTKENCDRCGTKLVSRKMSWFTDDTICSDCSSSESEIRKALPMHGHDYEGCGYIPKVFVQHD